MVAPWLCRRCAMAVRWLCDGCFVQTGGANCAFLHFTKSAASVAYSLEFALDLRLHDGGQNARARDALIAATHLLQ